MIAFACASCGKKLRIGVEHAEKQIRCPACKECCRIPNASPAAVQPCGGTVAWSEAASAPLDGEPATLPPSSQGDAERTMLPAPAPESATLAPAASAGPETLAPTTPAGMDRTGTDRDGVPGYEILGELGRGGMGVVYKARQVGLNRLCALKMILAGGHAGEADLARFRTEGEAVARLQHPNIVAVYEVGQHDGKPFFSLEFCPGGSLDRKLAGTPIDPKEAAQLMRTLAQAMQAAHQANVIHRDLKPATVLLCGDGTPKITDFGLAKKLDESGQTQTGAIMGTPSYMAPEQAEGKKDIGPPADVYALGAILYECLTGRPPFKAATSFDTILQVAADEPVPPRQLNAKAPADLETICLKCLQKAPGKRYRSAAELADDLGRFLAGEPIHARPVGRMEQAGKWMRRNPAVAALTAAVAASLLLGACTATVLAVRADREANEAKRLAGEEKKAREEAGKQGERAEREAKEAKRLAEEAQAAREKAEKSEKMAKAEAHKANVGRHGFQMTAACQAWQQHDVATAEALLEDVPPAFQHTWEYRHVRSICRRTALPLLGHTGPVRSVAISRDGMRIVGGGGGGYGAQGKPRPGEVKVWDAATAREMFSLKGHTFYVTSVAISRDGACIVSGSADKTVKVWDAATGQEKRSLKGHTKGVSSVAISSDAKRIVSASHDNTVKVWDAATGQEKLSLKGHAAQVLSVAISRDGTRIVSGSVDNTVKVWDAATGQEMLTLKGHTGPVSSVAISRDGTRIMSGSQDKTVKVWDAPAAKP